MKTFLEKSHVEENYKDSFNILIDSYDECITAEWNGSGWDFNIELSLEDRETVIGMIEDFLKEDETEDYGEPYHPYQYTTTTLANR